jgi:hypothetical protein
MTQAGSKYHYVYRSYEPLGRSYIGKRTCFCLPEEDTNYFGSYSDPDFYPTQKEILAICETSGDALEVEIFFHWFYDVACNNSFANKAKQTSKYFNVEGVPKSEEHRKKISESNKGVPFTEEHCLAISEAKRGRPVSESCRLAQIAAVSGRPKSKEHRRKIAEANTGKKMAEEARKKMSAKRRKNNMGRGWWVNFKGETMFQHECPGPEWQKGRKWRG